MAADIIPIQLSLTQGDGVTLWAPHWQEDGEEWEAFLGHGESLYVLPDAAHLAAFIRSNDEHDLVDHPRWDDVRDEFAGNLVPQEDHQFDIIGIPDLVSAPPDAWLLAELADTVAILRSLAEVCGLDAVDEVLSSSAGFTAASEGPTAFVGRAGKKLWNEVTAVVSDRWDTVIDALDNLVATPNVAADALTAAQLEIRALRDAERAAEANNSADASGDTSGESESADNGAADRDPDLAFWDEVGIDCLSITCDGRTGWTLRCYLGDDPVFLSVGGKIQLYPSPTKLEEYLTDPTVENALSHLDAWTTIREAIDGGEASVIASSENTYRVDKFDDDLSDGPAVVDSAAFSLAVELLEDAAQSRGDEEVSTALSSATPLGNLVRAVTHPDPDRLPPSPPFDDEVTAWRALTATFAANLEWN